MNRNFPLLQAFTGTEDIRKLPQELVKEIQTILGITADGIVGNQTVKTFSDFKDQAYLGFPLILGESTVAALLAYESQDIHEQATMTTQPVVLPDAGTRSGRSFVLPGNLTVFQNEFIVPGIPITWGEVTSGMAQERRPTTFTVVLNLERVARAFGEIRDRYGKPIAITSGYRPPAVNRRIGGATFSQHIHGLALDIRPMDMADMNLLYDICGTCSQIGARGDGRRRGFIHIDCRPRVNGRLLTFPY